MKEGSLKRGVDSATGFAIGMNVPDSAVPVIKSAKIDYLKRATGSLRAEATLAGEQRRLIAAEPKGQVLVQCRVTDDSRSEPIQCEMIWAWIPRKEGLTWPLTCLAPPVHVAHDVPCNFRGALSYVPGTPVSSRSRESATADQERRTVAD